MMNKQEVLDQLNRMARRFFRLYKEAEGEEYGRKADAANHAAETLDALEEMLYSMGYEAVYVSGNGERPGVYTDIIER